MSDNSIEESLPTARREQNYEEEEEEATRSSSSCNSSFTSVTLSSLKSFEDYEILQSDSRRRALLRSLRVQPDLFQCEGFRSPTMKNAKNMIRSLKETEALEEVFFHGNMSLDNIHDVEVIKHAIESHPSLRSMNIRDFVVYANDHPDTKPLLEPLLHSASSISNLESFQLKCFAIYKQWNRAFCTCLSLKPLCLSTRLESLSLSGLGLRDEHFVFIAQEVGNNKETRIRKLILNDNENTDVGICAMTALLASNKTIERLEAHSRKRLSQTTCEAIVQTIERNHEIKYFCSNTHTNYRSKIDYCLLLNRTGRKTMLDPTAGPEKIIDVLVAADGNVSVLMGLLRENPSICRVQERQSQIPQATFISIPEVDDPTIGNSIEEVDNHKDEGEQNSVFRDEESLVIAHTEKSHVLVFVLL